MPLSPGTQLGQYEVVESVGAGGMGEVYRARDTKLGRDVAIKILPEEFAQDKDRLDRFEREARLLAQLNHANVATLYGFEESGGQQYLVMELVEGETLAEQIAAGAISIREAIALFSKIAEGLEAAHDKRIVHRDLKPANIKIGPDGKPKILDFGLAKALVGDDELARDSSQSPTLTKKTALGTILGTASYMSPEQARGKPVDKRTDLWAFGCCLYETLTGRRAFDGETVSDTIAHILDRDPDWQSLPEDLPPSVRRLLRRCLRKNRDERWRDAGDARIELGSAADELDVPPRRTSSGNSRKLLLWMSAATLASLAIAAWGLLRSVAPDVAVVRSTISLPDGAALSVRTSSDMAFSPDGRRIAFVAGSAEGRRLYIRELDSPESRAVEGSQGASGPFFSPDGQWLGFASDDALRKVSIQGGPSSIIAEGVSDLRGASWGADDNVVFVPQHNGGLYQVSADGGEPRSLTVPNRENREKSHRFPQVLPDGTSVLFTLVTGDIASFEDASIAILSLETGEYRVVLDGGAHGVYVDSGHLVYARSGSLFVVPFDLERREVRGASVQVADGLAHSVIYGAVGFSASRNGHLLYASGEPSARTLTWFDRDGNREPISDESRFFHSVRLSPNERFLAVTLEGANASAWVYDLERDTLIQVASEFDNYGSFWAPDGAHLAVPSNRDGNWELFLHGADGSEPAQKLTSGRNALGAGSWSPDGRSLLFQEYHQETGWDVTLLSLDGEPTVTPFLDTKHDELQPMLSPSGRHLAYESNESGQWEVYVRAFPGPGRKWLASSGGGRRPRWNPNGRELFYETEHALMVVDVETQGELSLGKARTLFEMTFPGFWDPVFDVAGDYDVADNGQRFVMIEAEPNQDPTELVLVQNWFDELKRLVPADN